ncbi:hypothetical protein C8R47DRAFT_1157762 [Mycena vitilis]|nr:hypothetical protein C8R47DRAFT_1157762 [Mycena vitilis]
MRVPLFRRAQKSALPTVKLKSSSPRTPTALPDVLSTTLIALKESAEVFPPLQSAVAGVIAVWDIAKRAKLAKTHASDIALRTEKILYIIVDAVPDFEAITQPMLRSIERFTALLNEIHGTMEEMGHSGRLSRVIHLNRNEQTLLDIKAQLDDAYRDFSVASALRVEAQQMQIKMLQRELDIRQKNFALQQKEFAFRQTIAIGKVSVRERLSPLHFSKPWRHVGCPCPSKFEHLADKIIFSTRHFFWPGPPDVERGPCWLRDAK